MIDKQGTMVIHSDAAFKGEIRKCNRLEVRGYFEGTINAATVVIEPGGRAFGTLNADNAEVRGTFQGEVAVRQLFNVSSSGVVTGKIRYGQLAMERGGTLSAELRNIPPTLVGDLNLTVTRGQSVAITTVDLAAVDPDDDAKDLVFTIRNPVHGFVALRNAPEAPVSRFTLADVEGGRVAFCHDGTGTDRASFDVSVADDDGATSGAPQTVTVTVSQSAF